MKHIQTFCLTGAQSAGGNLSMSAHIGDCADEGKLMVHMEWPALPGVSEEGPLPDFLLAAMERLVEMFHTGMIMSIESERVATQEDLDAL